MSDEELFEKIMNFLAPLGPVYQAGTLSGNPIAMSAGLAMLTYLNEHNDVYSSLAEKTNYLRLGMEKVLDKTNISYHINSIGSMISLHFTMPLHTMNLLADPSILCIVLAVLSGTWCLKIARSRLDQGASFFLFVNTRERF